MNEYGFEMNETTETTQPAPKPKKRIALKKTAAVMAMAIVSAGSIGAYAKLAPAKEPVISVSAPEENKESLPVSKPAAIESVSYFDAAAVINDGMDTESIVEKLLPSVVGIESTFTVTSQGGYMYGFGGYSQPKTSTGKATGTGVIITENGYIVTNAHVIYDSDHGAGLADSVSVLVNDDKSYDAEVIGYDTDCDLAVLKINGNNFTAAEFGDSDKLRLGESVIAIGNPLGFELMNTVTKGIISGKNRQITINEKAMNLLQTDAAINSGNSGGPLISSTGKVIGINSSKMSASYSQTSIEGIGFAIPSNEVSKIVKDLMEYGYVTGKPQLGISCQDVTETIARMYNLPVGVYVTAVEDNGAAELAGLSAGDVITAVDGNKITTTEELNKAKNDHSAGDTIEVEYVRNGKTHTAEIVLGEAVKKQ